MARRRFGIRKRVSYGFGLLLILILVLAVLSATTFQNLIGVTDRVLGRMYPVADQAQLLHADATAAAHAAESYFNDPGEATLARARERMKTLRSEAEALRSRLTDTDIGVAEHSARALHDEVVAYTEVFDSAVRLRQATAEAEAAFRRNGEKILTTARGAARQAEENYYGALYEDDLESIDALFPKVTMFSGIAWVTAKTRILEQQLVKTGQKDIFRQINRNLENVVRALDRVRARESDAERTRIQDALAAARNYQQAAETWEVNHAKLTQDLAEMRRIAGDLLARVTTISGTIQRRAQEAGAAAQAESRFARNSVTVLSLAILGLAVLVAVVLVRSVVPPLLALQRSMQKRAAGVDAPIPMEGEDEIADMGRSFAYFVSEIERRENALRAAREEAEAATRTKGEFLANMSHEIRTPMNAIVGMTRLMQRTRLDEQQRDYMEKTSHASQSLLTVINDILDFSKIEAGKLTIETIVFDFEEVLHNVSDVIGLRAEEKGLEMVFKTEQAVPAYLSGDPLRLGQVLLNLTSNAVKFTERGEIVITTEVAEDDGEALTLKFSVSDTGIGMSAAQQAKLFQAFSQADSSTTRRFGGTGLGLAICQRLVQLMGGEIWLESEQGVGTTFYFTLPLERASEADAEAAAASRPSISVRGNSALVVDDNETNRLVLMDMLKSWGFEVEAAATGEAAVDAVRRARERARTFDMILMDWKLPGIDGVAASRKIQELFGDTSPPLILMITAYDRSEIVPAARAAGIPSILAKPLTGSQLYNAILDAYQGQPEESGDPSAEPEGLSEADRARLAKARVLLVEDNEINQQVGRELLEEVGVSVDIAANGQAGVDAVRSATYDLVLMDIQMPVMDGFTATRELRGDPRFKDLPIVAMTAHAMSGDREKSLAAGMNDHLAKPVEADKLYGVLLRWLPAEPVGAPAFDDADMDPTPAAPRQIESVDKGAAGPAVPEEDATGLPSSLPGLDIAGALRNLGNKEDLYRRTAAKFRDTYAQGLAPLRAHLDGGDTESRAEARRWAHSLKSLAGTVGARALSEAAAELESTIADGATVDEDLLARVDGRLGEVRASLEGLCGAAEPESGTPEPDDGGGGETADPATVRERIDALAAELDQGSLEAETALNRLRMALGTAGQGRLDNLASLVEVFEFEEARRELDQLAAAVLDD